jgi:hypothetical protein
MLPRLLKVLRRLPMRGFDNVAGTHRRSAGPRDELVIHALAQSGEAEAVASCARSRAADLQTKLVLAVPEVLDFIALTKDDEARVLGLGAAERFNARLDAAGLAVVALLVGELLARLTSRSAALVGEQDGWASLGVGQGCRCSPARLAHMARWRGRCCGRPSPPPLEAR